MKRVLTLVVIIAVLGAGSIVFGQDEAPVTTHSDPPDGEQYQLVEAIPYDFRRPVLVTHAGDGSGRLFVVEQNGDIYVVIDGTLQETPFLDVSEIITTDANERGLLGLAFHPNYAENGHFFINFTNRDGNTEVVRYTVSADDPNRADAASAFTILTIAQPYANHNGGNLVFGPDGYLYIGTGDGGSGGDPQGNGQNPQALLGKMLRIDVDSGAPYGIPADNPYTHNPDLAPEVWAIGLRNPWRYSFDRATGDLYIADVGQNQWEEVNFQPAASTGGENYGWNLTEGRNRFREQNVDMTGLTLPFFDYNHVEGCSVTGGYVYRGAALPELQGYYFFGDYCSGTIWASYRDESGTWQTHVFMRTEILVSSFGEDEAGELYVVNHNGIISRLEAK